MPPTIDTHGASTSVPKPVVLRIASPHLVVLLTVVDCATVRQSCSCGALFATRQQPAVGSVHRDRLADSAGARCDRWPRNYRRKLSSGLLGPGSARLGLSTDISYIARTWRQLPPQHWDCELTGRCDALQAGTRCRLAANEVEPAEQETDSSKFEISSQRAANSTTKHMPMQGLRGRFNPVAAAALCAVLVVPGSTVCSQTAAKRGCHMSLERAVRRQRSGTRSRP